MKHFIKTYFSYSTREIRGIVILLLLIVLVVAFPYVYDAFKPQQTWDHSGFIEQVNQIISASESPAEKPEEPVALRFKFNPNTITKPELLAMGFSDKQSNTLINYRKAGGSFIKKEDLKKVYGVDAKLYRSIEPYIVIPEPKQPDVNQKSVDKDEKRSILNEEDAGNRLHATNAETAFVLDLNAATEADLIRIPGIGATYAKRIVGYRNYLGGFYTKEQLTEVYGISDTLLKSIQSYLNIDTSAIVKIDLNTVTFKDLNKHPYMDYIQTKNIFKYLELMEKISDPRELFINHLMDSVTYAKMRPYLLVQ